MTLPQDNLQRQRLAHPVIDDSHFATYEEQIIHLMHLRAYEEAASLAEGNDVLDWGCNAGYGIEILAQTASRVAGLDLSPDAVATARRRLGPSIRLELYDGYHCPFAPDTFDLVTSFQVIEHVSDSSAYLQQICRVLHPSGLALFTTPNAILRLDPGMPPWNEFHVREYRPHELASLLRNHFREVRVKGLFSSSAAGQIEYRRLERSRHLARQSRWKVELKALARQYFPNAFRWLRDCKRTLTPKARIPEEFDSQRFSTADFFYQEGDLEQAIDLMAICRWPAKPQ